MLFNARGIKSKHNNLEYEIKNHKCLPNIIFVTETWLDQFVVISRF